MKFIGFYNYTVILTYISLVSGVLGIKFSYDGRVGLAVCCLVFSGICDMFDGAVARTKKDRTEDQKNFGIQLDSLCDVVCFGVLPAIILYFLGIDSIVGIAMLIFYVLCAVIRLAFFNVLEAKRQKSEDGCAKAYRGLPVTSAAIILPFFFLLGFLLSDKVMIVIYYILPAITGLAFITDFRVPKLDVSKLLRRRAKKSAEEKEECECDSLSNV